MAKRKQARTLDPTEQDQAQKHDTGNEVAIDIEELKHDKNALEDILRRRDKWKECIQTRVQAQADEKAAKDSMIEAIDSANEWKNADAPLYKQNPEWASKPLTEIGLSDHIVGKIEGVTLPDGRNPDLLCTTGWPKVSDSLIDEDAVRGFEHAVANLGRLNEAVAGGKPDRPALVLVDHIDPAAVAEDELEADRVVMDHVRHRAAVGDADVTRDDRAAEP